MAWEQESDSRHPYLSRTLWRDPPDKMEGRKVVSGGIWAKDTGLMEVKSAIQVSAELKIEIKLSYGK